MKAITDYTEEDIWNFFENLKLGYSNDLDDFYMELEDIRVPIPKDILLKFMITCKERESVARNILEQAKIIKKMK
jgi:hypothetical protein